MGSGSSTPTSEWCSDFDEDCHDIPDKKHCQSLNPSCGKCPYLHWNGIIEVKEPGDEVMDLR